MRKQYALELDERLLVEADVIEIVDEQLALVQTIANRIDGEALVVLLAGEPLLGRGGDDLTVANQAGRGVVVEARDAEDVHARFFPTSTRRLLVLQSLSVALQQYACTLHNKTKEQLLLKKEKK